MTIREWAKIRKSLTQGDCYNKQVKEWFGNDDNETRATLKDLCLIAPKDSIAIAQQRIRFFREEVQKVHLKPDIIGMPKIDVDADVTYKPEVTLFFKQNKQSVPKNKTAKTAKASYRLMNQTSSSLSKTDLKNLGRDIYNDFATPVYRFNKGKIIAWYLRPEQGLHLQIYCHTEEIGETVIKKILQHRSLSFDDDFLKFSNPRKSTDLTPGNITILGEQREKPIWRPSIFVEFEYAAINLHNDTQVRILCDLSGNYANPFYRP